MNLKKTPLSKVRRDQHSWLIVKKEKLFAVKVHVRPCFVNLSPEKYQRSLARAISPPTRCFLLRNISQILLFNFAPLQKCTWDFGGGALHHLEVAAIAPLSCPSRLEQEMKPALPDKWIRTVSTVRSRPQASSKAHDGSYCPSDGYMCMASINIYEYGISPRRRLTLPQSSAKLREDIEDAESTTYIFHWQWIYVDSYTVTIKPFNSLSASLLLNIFLSFEVGIAHAIANFKWKENTSSLKN